VLPAGPEVIGIRAWESNYWRYGKRAGHPFDQLHGVAMTSAHHLICNCWD
jgi:hypothetical protein